MSTALRIGVIGTGRIGRMHADYIARHTPRATLSAVSDVNAASAAEVGAAYGVPAVSAAEAIAMAHVAV